MCQIYYYKKILNSFQCRVVNELELISVKEKTKKAPMLESVAKKSLGIVYTLYTALDNEKPNRN